MWCGGGVVWVGCVGCGAYDANVVCFSHVVYFNLLVYILEKVL